MSENERMKWFVLRHIAENVQCASCHRSYAPDEVHILAHREGLWFVKVACDYCGTEGLILVMLETRPADGSAESASPLHTQKALPLKEAPLPTLSLITEDEVADIRRFLEAYHGNLSELWEDEL